MFEHTRGDSWLRAWVFKVQDRDPVTEEPLVDEDGNPVLVPMDITGVIVRLHLRGPDGKAVIKATVGDTEVADKYLTLTPLDGRIDLNVPGEDMQLEILTYKYDVEIVFTDGRTVTIDKNKIKVVEDQTHDD